MDEVKLTNFAKLLQELRGEKALNQVQSEAGIDRGSLRKYETGKLVPEKIMLKKLAKHYGVDFSVLQKAIFEDLYPKASEERKILIDWAQELSK